MQRLGWDGPKTVRVPMIDGTIDGGTRVARGYERRKE
jgi:hypothetical protein